MRSILAIVIGLGLTFPPNSGQCQDITLNGPSGPVTIRFQVFIDGQPAAKVHRRVWDEYITALFQHLDGDGDGFLSETEGQCLPPPTSIGRRSSRPTNLAFNFRVVDDNGDGKIDRQEAAAYYRDHGSDGFTLSNLTSAPISGNANNALTRRLDRDRDGKLTADELAYAGSLIELDTNGDELLSPAEISRSLPGVTGGPSSAPMNRSEAARARRPFVLSDQAQIEPAIELVIRLGQLGTGEKPLEVLRKLDQVSIEPTDVGATIRLPGNTIVALTVNADRPLPVVRTRQQLLDQFKAADVGRKGHVTLKDAQLRSFFPQQFPLLDRNLDGKLTEAELLTYLDKIQSRQAQAVTSVVSVLGTEAGNGLFDLLDSNRDGRLSAAELRGAKQLPSLVGVESLTASTMPRVYRLAVALCQTSFDRGGAAGVFIPRGLPMLALDWSPPGLVWFHKMDRNRDGFLSPREFLGPMATFRKLDTDADGLIGPNEAPRGQ